MSKKNSFSSWKFFRNWEFHVILRDENFLQTCIIQCLTCSSLADIHVMLPAEYKKKEAVIGVKNETLHASKVLK